MTGLQRVLKMYGSAKCGDQLWLWDYAQDVPVRAEEMPAGSERRKASDMAKAKQMRAAHK